MFYEQGIKVAFEQLGMAKEASRALLPLAGVLGGAGKGALVGGGVGGVTGAVSADEGQGWEGFKRGLGRGAAAGATLGGLGGLARGAIANKALGAQGQKDLYQRVRAQQASQAELQNLNRYLSGGSVMKGLAGGIAGATGKPEPTPWG